MVLGMFGVVFVVAICGVPFVERLTTINFVLAAAIVDLLGFSLSSRSCCRGWVPCVSSSSASGSRQHRSSTDCQIRAVQRVRFAADPDEDYADRETASQLYEATVEIHSGRPIRLIVTQRDADRLRQWAVAKGIAVSERH